MLRLLAVFLLIAINAFFVTTEFAMVSVRRSRINQLAAAGDVQAQTVQDLQRSIERLLSTTQFGITLSSLALGWIGEGTMAVVVRACLSYLPLPANVQDGIAHSLSFSLLTFFLLAYLQIVLGELAPKSIALQYAEQLSRTLGPASLVIARCFHPFVWVLDQSTRTLLRFAGIEYATPHRPVTPEELQLIIATSSESTGLHARERELLNNVFEFGAVSVTEIMTPRTSIATISRSANFQNLLDEIAISGHFRYPVIRESIDDILGLLDFKQLLKPLAEGHLTPNTPIATWIRPVRFVPEVMLLGELLPLMQRTSEEMVVVVDEYGGTVGLVTLQDLTAEIIGDLYDASDSEEITMQMLDERTFLVQAQLPLEDVNEVLTLDLPVTDEYQTLGGFLIYQLQKIPAVGEVLRYRDLELTVVSANGPRLDQIRIHRLEATPATQLLEELTEDSLLDIPSDVEVNQDSLRP